MVSVPYDEGTEAKLASVTIGVSEVMASDVSGSLKSGIAGELIPRPELREATEGPRWCVSR